MSKRRHNFGTKRFKEKSLFIFHARIALKSLILLFVRLIARGARIGKTHRQTDKTSIYCNPRACAPRVNNYNICQAPRELNPTIFQHNVIIQRKILTNQCFLGLPLPFPVLLTGKSSLAWHIYGHITILFVTISIRPYQATNNLYICRYSCFYSSSYLTF